MSAAAHASLASKIAQIRAVFDGAALRGVARLGDMLPTLGDDVLLHAGPPLADGALSYPVRNAAIHALVYAGWNAGEAAAAIDDRAVRLAPAQDHGVVTPLAQVVSTAMPVFRVGDDAHEIFAPIAESAPPALRFGSGDPACVKRLQQQSDWAFDRLAPRLADTPLPVLDWIEVALAEGDECHARTGVANARLLSALGDLPDDYADTIAANANFVLPILMAASAWAMRKRVGGSIAAVGGNGTAFGVRLAGTQHWRSITAVPPTGVCLPDSEQAPVLGAVGDSPVIDFCGLGGQALEFAPDLVAAWGDRLPDDWAQRGHAVLDPQTDRVCAERIATSGVSPLVHLAMVDASADGGLAGRGFYLPDIELFRG